MTVSERMSDERLATIAEVGDDCTFIPYPAYTAYELYDALRVERTAYDALVSAIFRGFAQMDESDQIPMYGEVMPVLESNRVDSPDREVAS